MIATIGRWLTRRMIENPVFVVGAGRSGTSVLMQSLGCHPAVLSMEVESPFIPYLGYLAHPFALRENRRYHLESMQIPLDYAFEHFRRLCLECAMGADYGLHGIGARPGVLLGLLSRYRHWCAKTFPNAEEAESLTVLFPHVKFLYIFRNGIEVVNSRAHFRGMRGLPFHEHCEIWARHVEKYDYLHGMAQALPVRHEDLVEKPEATLNGILRHIGLADNDKPAQFLRTTLVHSLDQRTQTNVDALQTLRERPRAHETWSREEKRVFARLCGTGMARLGYELPF
jgi:hypothetical protein